jgi:hypothetical protein
MPISHSVCLFNYFACFCSVELLLQHDARVESTGMYSWSALALAAKEKTLPAQFLKDYIEVDS